MKLALCTEILYPLYGVERRVYEFAKRLPKYGIDVEVFTSTSPRHFKDINIVQVSHPTIIRPPKRNFAFSLDYTMNLFRHLMRREYDIINAEGHMSLAPSSFAGLMRKKPVVATIHDLYLGEWRSMYKGKLSGLGAHVEIMYCKMPFTQILTVNSSLKNKMNKILRMKNVEILHSGIDTKYIDSVKHGKKDGSIVYISRLVPQKNVDTLIRAYALLPASIRKDHSLKIIGEGSERQKLESLSKQLNVKVDFLGKVERHEDVIGLLKAADLFVLPSRRESFGITVIEAMYCGVPVISTATEGPSDHVRNGETGFLVGIGNEKEMSLRMSEILENNTLRERISRNSVAYAEQHDWEKITKNVAGVYKKVLEK